MSSDSLDLEALEEDSSDEEPEMNGCWARGRSSKDQGNSAISHLEDPFVPANAERENDLQTDDPEQLSGPFKVTCFHIPTSFSLYGGGTLGWKSVMALLSGEPFPLLVK